MTLIIWTNKIITDVNIVVIVTRCLPRHGGMTEDHGTPKAEQQLSRVWTRGRIDTESRQRASDAKSP